MENTKRVPWNKGKVMPKRIKYTNGEKNISLLEGEIPPEGFWKGQTSHYTEETRRNQILKTKQTKLERYGDEHYNNQSKYIQTCMERYGVDNVHKLTEVKNKCRETNLSRYGVDNLFKDTERIQNSFKEKYGVTNPSQILSAKNKLKQTWKSKDKTELDKILAQRKDTCQEKYGVPFYSKSDEYLKKVQSTCLERYGVPYYTLTDDIRKYNAVDSIPNLRFKDMLDRNNIPYEREFVVSLKRFDFRVGNTLIEINPSITHSSTENGFFKPKGKEYHKLKAQLATEAGFDCITVWDWDDLEKIQLFLKDRGTLYARQCKIKEISNMESIQFLSLYHLQGAINSSICIGLYHKNELVSVMTFGKPRYNKNYEYELLRYCSSKNIIGGAEKMFKYFLKNYNPSSIVSYCDMSKFSGRVYEKLGFKLLRTSIGKHWYNLSTGKHITQNLLQQQGFDRLLGEQYGRFGKGTSNDELMKKFGFVEIYDCGQATYIWQ